MPHLIQVLGPGCIKCERLAKNVERVAAELGLDCRIEKVTDIEKITDYGILMTPGLVIDGEVRSTGRVLTPPQLREMLS